MRASFIQYREDLDNDGGWAEETTVAAPQPSASFLRNDFDILASVGPVVLSSFVEASEVSVIDAGAVYVFTEAADVWTASPTLTADNLSGNDDFGQSVDISGNWLISGAPGFKDDVADDPRLLTRRLPRHNLLPADDP